MSGSLRIATWNANGLSQHLAEFEVFLHSQTIDICCVSETHFTNQSAMNIPGYEIYSTPHPANKARGGAAVIIRSNIHHYENSKFETEHIQSASVHVKTSRYNLNIAAAYCPPKHNLKKDDYLPYLMQLGNNFIAGGDWNAKHRAWGSRLTTTKGRELYSAASELKCDFESSGHPTYWPTDTNKTPDLLDFFITRGLSSHYLKTEHCLDLNSDHSPVILTLSDSVITSDVPPRLTNPRTDWSKYQSFLTNNVCLTVLLKSPQQLESDIDSFASMLKVAAKISTPEMKKILPGKNYPLEVKQLILDKRRARRQWQESRNPEKKTTLNRITNTLKKVLIAIENQNTNKFINDLSPHKDHNYSLFKVTKKLKCPVVKSTPIRKPDRSWARSNQEKADAHADFLEKAFLPFPASNEEELPPANSRIDHLPIKPVTPKEVIDIISKLESKKSAGIDQITPTMLKQLPRQAMVKLTHHFNAAIRMRYMPRQWKVAEIITLPKPGKPTDDVASYRPISLLSVIAKIFEKLIRDRLKPIITERNIIPNHQFGFRDNHSTIDQVHRISEFIESAYEEKKTCAAVFLDVSQAFDKVWHDGLNYKLRNMLPTAFSDLLQSYLSDRTFRVRQGDSFSSLRKISAGVPQGSVLASTLYTLYTADIPQNKDVMQATFADDTAILAKGINTRYATMKLQSAINSTCNWTKQWRIKLNQAKSQHINFTLKKDSPLPITIDGTRVPKVKAVKYLGMTLDAKLNWKEHVRSKISQAKSVRAKLKMLVGRGSKLSLQNKLLIYKQVIRPIFTYGIQLWACAPRMTVKKVQMYQNITLRTATNAPYYCRNNDLHRDLQIQTIAELARSAATQHIHRLEHHPNPLAKRLLRPRGRRLHRKLPRDLAP